MIARIHATDVMTSRERLLATYKGQRVDRLPYWAKVANPTWRTSQPKRVRDWTTPELLDYIHADGIFGAGSGTRLIRPHISETQTRDGNVRTKVTRTPDGDLTETWTLDPYTNSWHPTEFPVKTTGDLARLRWCFTDVRAETDDQALARAVAAHEAVGQRGVTHCWAGTSPLMHLIEHVIGPVNTTYMLDDHPDRMNELIELMHQANLTALRHRVEHTPADVVVSGENTSTTLISPRQFERYCYRHLCDHGRIIQAAGKIHELHMCGLLLALLEKIDTIPAASIEAYTSPTLGNTRLVDGRTRAPTKTLIGGTNVNVWLWPLEKIQAYIQDELSACPDHRRIVLTTAGVAPPGCPAEKFRAVGEWIHTLPLKM